MQKLSNLSKGTRLPRFESRCLTEMQYNQELSVLVGSLESTGPTLDCGNEAQRGKVTCLRSHSESKSMGTWKGLSAS